MNKQRTYILFNKPYGVLSQFTPEAGYRSLRDFGPFPLDVYPVGRLDADSEGLLFLTNDNRVKHRLISPQFNHPRTYWAQVEGVPSEESLNKLRTGIHIEGKPTKPADVCILTPQPDVPPRAKPIRYRKTIPTTWIELTLYEGRNRQVRKMTAAVGHPTLRLIRVAIACLHLDGLEPGSHRYLTADELHHLSAVLSLSL
ncbi:MAG: pseudouridine synthase [Bacteroidetes bacterium]|nr:pseudouridine synthase [Bacteroidota bacterium]